MNWYDLVGREKAKEMIEKSLSDGRVILEDLNTLGVPVYLVPGNWDWTKEEKSKWDFLRIDHYKTLTKRLKNLVDVHHKKVDAKTVEFIGHGIISGPEYPQYADDLAMWTKEELIARKKKYEKTKGMLAKLFERAKKPVIFLPHNVPFNTSIDIITNEYSPRKGRHYGSLIARELIDEFQPLVCVGGHMHEHFTSCKLGKTACINAGFGSEVNVLLEIEGNLVKKMEFCNKK